MHNKLERLLLRKIQIDYKYNNLEKTKVGQDFLMLHTRHKLYNITRPQKINLLRLRAQASHLAIQSRLKLRAAYPKGKLEIKVWLSHALDL